MNFLVHLALVGLVVYLVLRGVTAYERASSAHRIERAGRNEIARHDARTSRALLEIAHIDRETHHRIQALRREARGR